MRSPVRPHLRSRRAQLAVPPRPRGPSWGLHVGVRPGEGRWGWDGGSGTSAWVDPRRDVVAVLLTQRGFAGPDDEPKEFWGAVQASAASD